MLSQKASCHCWSNIFNGFCRPTFWPITILKIVANFNLHFFPSFCRFALTWVLLIMVRCSWVAMIWVINIFQKIYKATLYIHHFMWICCYVAAYLPLMLIILTAFFSKLMTSLICWFLVGPKIDNHISCVTRKNIYCC